MNHLESADLGAGYPDEASRLRAVTLGNRPLTASVVTDPKLDRSMFPEDCA
ncbi:hypothetical protein [Cryobacterium sp. TMT2-4]|uniref:hypothetical protein n=1 Tax=Cryobacterium sp. TMT2-4 TaxID=1259254 RepID=UPI00141AE05E|nr:hypothetical protein [Cryobacterium sp. TMT2-4]